MRSENISAVASSAATQRMCTTWMPGIAQEVTWIAWLKDVADSQSLN